MKGTYHATWINGNDPNHQAVLTVTFPCDNLNTAINTATTQLTNLVGGNSKGWTLARIGHENFVSAPVSAAA